MDLYCTRPGCPKTINPFPDLDDPSTLKTVQQKYCTTCGMPLILAGRYLPQKLLGQGGFGAAFLACDRYSPRLRPCVVKQFQPATTLTPTQLQTAQELFEREAETLEDLGNPHPQIPDLYAYFELSVQPWQPGTTDRFFYLAQEFIDGQTLEEELAQSGAFSSDAVMQVLQATLKILHFVHEKGVIHRDIKPSNIMRNRQDVIYLLDFGAVRQVTKGAAQSTGIYSEGFAPPEQMNGSAVFPSTDLYALAVTCIMLLTNQHPNALYDGYTGTWKWRHHALATEPNLADVLDRMLQTTPSDRYQSVLEVLQALRASPLAPVTQAHPPRSTARTGPRSVAKAPAGQATALPTPQSAPSVQPAPMQPAPIQPTPGAAPIQPATPVAPVKAARRTAAIAPFSTVELLGEAGFTGFQAGLLGIAVTSLLGTTLISGGFWLLLVAGLVLIQSRRIIERVDLVIIAGASLALVLLIAPLRQALPVLIGSHALVTVVAIAGLTGLLAIAATALFRLIYKMLSSFL